MGVVAFVIIIANTIMPVIIVEEGQQEKKKRGNRELFNVQSSQNIKIQIK